MAKTRLPDFPVPGGCACGAVRYELTAAPLALFACHRADCQTLRPPGDFMPVVRAWRANLDHASSNRG